MKFAGPLGILLLAVTAVSGCVSEQLYQRSNAVEYLYAAGAEARPAGTVTLQMPVRVGVAFAPSSAPGKESFTEAQKQDLLERLAAKFVSRPRIEVIEIIPSSTLTPKGGFEDLDRLRASYRVSQIVLVSYDQVQFSNTGMLSLTYWVTYGAGAYVIKGEKNETRTLLDAVVYDIPSRTMLFHAVGQSSIKGSSTLMNMKKALRQRSAEGFNQAADDLTVNLEASLNRFAATLKDGQVSVEATPAIPAWDAARGAPAAAGKK